MTALIGGLVPLVTAFALLCAFAVLVVTRSVRTALPVLLDLLLVAGLLRLSATSSWAAIGTAAAVVAVRKVAGFGLAAGHPGHRSHAATR
ncbi:hypothetical protein [Flexivirga sp.]|uniref:hypothetical protein n=1 Tax=Flexivirga sp. TaxID=1962927 RepID=UPI003F7DDA28